MKRVIFGGSFDPLTKAHEAMAIKLSEHFDEVIVVPAFISPFKLGEMDLSGEERLMLLSKAFERYPSIIVSDCEIRGEGTSFSYLTAQKFYKEGDSLYFAIGSDGLGSLDRWAKPEILSKLVTFFVVKRPFFSIKEDDLNKAKKIFNIEIASFEGEEGSSSLLKVAVAFNRAEEIVPKFIADYIKEKGLYKDYCEITDKYPALKLKQSRIEHIYRTTKSAILLAKQSNANIELTVRASLLHDISKYLSDEELLSLGVKLDEEVYALPPSCRHQITGARLAKILFPNEDERVIRAIATHTTGADNMDIYQKIIFTADYIEEGRNFDKVNEIRNTCYENLDKGIVAIFKNTIEYLTKSGSEIAPATIKAYNKILKENIL